MLSKLNFTDTVTYPLPAFLQKKVQRVQNAAASFVLNRFCSEKDVLEVGWLPTLERTQYNIMKLVHEALHKDTWPSSLALIRHNTDWELRSSRAMTLQILLVKETWQKSAANLFNGLTETVRSCTNFSTFSKETYRIIQEEQADDSLNNNTLAKVFFIIHQLLLALFSLYIRIVLVCIIMVFLYTRIIF